MSTPVGGIPFVNSHLFLREPCLTRLLILLVGCLLFAEFREGKTQRDEMIRGKEKEIWKLKKMRANMENGGLIWKVRG